MSFITGMLGGSNKSADNPGAGGVAGASTPQNDTLNSADAQKMGMNGQFGTDNTLANAMSIVNNVKGYGTQGSASGGQAGMQTPQGPQQAPTMGQQPAAGQTQQGALMQALLRRY